MLILIVKHAHSIVATFQLLVQFANKVIIYQRLILALLVALR